MTRQGNYACRGRRDFAEAAATAAGFAEVKGVWLRLRRLKTKENRIKNIEGTCKYREI